MSGKRKIPRIERVTDLMAALRERECWIEEARPIVPGDRTEFYLVEERQGEWCVERIERPVSSKVVGYAERDGFIALGEDGVRRRVK
jgi:hypothetical protein